MSAIHIKNNQSKKQYEQNPAKTEDIRNGATEYPDNGVIRHKQKQNKSLLYLIFSNRR